VTVDAAFASFRPFALITRGVGWLGSLRGCRVRVGHTGLAERGATKCCQNATFVASSKQVGKDGKKGMAAPEENALFLRFLLIFFKAPSYS
jgi:hypothetical protein